MDIVAIVLMILLVAGMCIGSIGYVFFRNPGVSWMDYNPLKPWKLIDQLNRQGKAIWAISNILLVVGIFGFLLLKSC